MGAGDWLMAAGEARRIHEQTRRFVVILDRYGRPVRDAIWKGTPYITDSLHVGAVPLLNCGGHRPYIAGKTPERWIWKEYEPYPARLYLTPDEQSWAKLGDGAIVLNASLKAQASVNKRWPLDRWQVVADALRGHRLIQFPGDVRIPGVQVVETPTLRHAAAVVGAAQLVITHEGGLHHVAAAMKRQAVVLFGGYISPKQTGYKTHANLFTGGEPCGMRVRCAHCERAMAAITPEMVIEEARRVVA